MTLVVTGFRTCHFFQRAVNRATDAAKRFPRMFREPAVQVLETRDAYQAWLGGEAKPKLFPGEPRVQKHTTSPFVFIQETKAFVGGHDDMVRFILSVRPLRVGGVPEHFNIPIKRVAQELDVEWSDYKAGTGALCQALSDNELDVALVLTEGAVKHAFEKPDDALLHAIYVSSPLVWGVHCGGKSSWKSLADVSARGKSSTPVTFAISRLGSGSHLMAFCLAKREGWKDVRFEVCGGLAGAEKLLQDKRDVLFMWEKAMTAPLVEKGVFTRLGDFPTPWPCFVVSARRDVPPERVEAVLARVKQACADFKRNARGTSLEEVMGTFGMKREYAEEWMNAVEFSCDPGFEDGGVRMLESVKRTLMDIGQLSASEFAQQPVTGICVSSSRSKL